jgi:hypothetical protein
MASKAAHLAAEWVAMPWVAMPHSLPQGAAAVGCLSARAASLLLGQVWWPVLLGDDDVEDVDCAHRNRRRQGAADRVGRPD